MKSKFFSKIFCILLILPTVIFMGCQKDNASEATLNNSKIVNFRSTANPIVVNGTLKFSKLEDVFTYMKDLSNKIQQMSEQSDESDSINIVNPATTISNQLEGLLGFRSLYKESIKDGDGNLISPVFSDPAMNLVMNNNYEVIVGDSIFVHKNRSQYFIIKSSDNRNREILRNIPPGGEIDILNLNPDITIINEGPKIIKPRTKDCDCGLSLNAFVNTNPSGTNPFTLTHGCIGLVIGQTWTLKWTEVGGTQSGTISGTITGVGANQNTINFNVPASVKEIKVEFCVFLQCNDQPLKKYCFEISKSIAPPCCEKFQYLTHSEVFGPQGFELFSEYENGVAWLSYYHWGKTGFRNLSPSPNYLKAKKLEIWLHGRNRTAPDNTFPGPGPCVIMEIDDDFDSCTNCKSIAENIWGNQHRTFHKDGDVWFNYRGTRHSSFGATQITPTYCK